ncbi:MAG: DUF2017 domain-containing protein [Actinobacteria bacterium]|nr:DUF2017 domain-containing protein [Actinomycetota bacterium]
MRGPFKGKRGSVEARLADIEADAVRRIAVELKGGLDEPDEDMRRLFPPGYSDDAERSAEFERLTRDDLLQHKRDAVSTVISSIDDAGDLSRG